MRLIDFDKCNIYVIKDGFFSNLKKITDEINDSLVYIDDEKYIDLVKKSKDISCVIISERFKDEFNECSFGIAISDNPKASFIKINNLLDISYDITIKGNDCRISNKANIANNGVVIGNYVVIDDDVKIYPGVIIEDNCTIKKGVVLGSEGYDRVFFQNDKPLNIDHHGRLIIKRDTIICEYSVIDKACFNWDYTLIGEKTYIGRHVNISHGAKILSKATISNNVSICGNVIIGKNCYIGTGSLISNRIKIGDNSIIRIGSVVSKSLDDNSDVSGNFAIEHNKHIKNTKNIAK